jgi:hypothetical protein
MLFCPKRKLGKVDNFFLLCVKKNVLKTSQQVKYLSVYIDSKLSGENIVPPIVQKVTVNRNFCIDKQDFWTKRESFHYVEHLSLSFRLFMQFLVLWINQSI